LSESSAAGLPDEPYAEDHPRPVRVEGKADLELHAEPTVGWWSEECDNPDCGCEQHAYVQVNLFIRAIERDEDTEPIVKEVRLVLTQFEAHRLAGDLRAAADEQAYMAW
jgi:hypothetical protein